jgi:hypothetical protein
VLGLPSSVLWLLNKALSLVHMTQLSFFGLLTLVQFLSFFVDDMIITSDDISSIRALQSFLSQNFEMKDLGILSYFLGLEVTLSTDDYYLSQAKYASDLLSRAGLTGSKTTSSPFETNVKLLATDGEPLSDATLYRQLVGSLIYLTVT